MDWGTQPEIILSILLLFLGGYLGFGLLFGLVFALGGFLKRIDPSAEKGTWGFRLIVIPGCAIFWPYLLNRWRRGTPPPEEDSKHRKLARSKG